MNELTELVNNIKKSTDYQSNKKILREKMQTDLHLPYNNGLFKVSQELISFLAVWESDSIFLEDVYQNPIQIDREEFLAKCKERYQMVMNAWHLQHEEIKRARKV
jgi:hypothetical protein